MNPQDINILVGCEESQEVTKAFRALGFNAFSCDLQDCSGGHPEWHHKGDVMGMIYGSGIKWHLVIAHPPCTYLTVRAQYWNKIRNRDLEKQSGIEFFMSLTRLSIPFAIENPVGIMSTVYKKPTQIIHPFHFGDPFMKKTCLWINGLPKLNHSNIVEPKGPVYIGKNGRKLYWHDALPKSVNRAKIKSKTFPGIAKAMADQWGDYLLKNLQP
jgi:hypothetical protein